MKVGTNSIPSVVDEDFATQPNYPFITLGIIDDYIPISAYAGANFFAIDMQIKTVSNDKWSAKGLARQVHQALFMPEIYYYLGSKGISVRSVNSLPFVVDDLTNYKQYTSGLDVVFIINDEQEPTRDDNPLNFDIKPKGLN